MNPEPIGSGLNKSDFTYLGPDYSDEVLKFFLIVMLCWFSINEGIYWLVVLSIAFVLYRLVRGFKRLRTNGHELTVVRGIGIQSLQEIPLQDIDAVHFVKTAPRASTFLVFEMKGMKNVKIGHGFGTEERERLKCIYKLFSDNDVLMKFHYAHIQDEQSIRG